MGSSSIHSFLCKAQKRQTLIAQANRVWLSKLYFLSGLGHQFDVIPSDSQNINMSLIFLSKQVILIVYGEIISKT